MLQLQFELNTGEMAAQGMKNRLRSLTLQRLGCSMGYFAVADYEDLDRWGSHEGCIELHINGFFVPLKRYITICLFCIFSHLILSIYAEYVEYFVSNKCFQSASI